MFSIFKKNRSIDVPEWASFFDSKEYSVFISEVEKYFNKLNIPYKIVDGIINTDENDFGFGSLGLANVAQVCKQVDIKDYREKVAEHFDCLKRTHEFNKEFDLIKHDFESVKQFIAVRLYHTDAVRIGGIDNVIAKEFSGDICTLLVFDLPDSVNSIKSEEAEKWEKSIDELFDLGFKNIKTNYPLEISLEKFNEFKIWFVQGDHFFAPNIVFDLKNRKELIGSKGSLVGLPHRHSVIIYPIESLEVVKVINQLIPTIYGMNQEGPGSLSNHLFWYDDGQFTNLPYTIEDQKLQFFPPDIFVETLNSLE